MRLPPLFLLFSPQLPKNVVIAVDIKLKRQAQIREIKAQTIDANREIRLIGEAVDGTRVVLQDWKAFPREEVVTMSMGDALAVVELRLEIRHCYRWGSMNAGVDVFELRGIES